jgi:hypothetical protein
VRSNEQKHTLHIDGQSLWSVIRLSIILKHPMSDWKGRRWYYVRYQIKFGARIRQLTHESFKCPCPYSYPSLYGVHAHVCIRVPVHVHVHVNFLVMNMDINMNIVINFHLNISIFEGKNLISVTGLLHNLVISIPK